MALKHYAAKQYYVEGHSRALLGYCKLHQAHSLDLSIANARESVKLLKYKKIFLTVFCAETMDCEYVFSKKRFLLSVLFAEVKNLFDGCSA